MCIVHNPELLKQWRFENCKNDVIVAYKIIHKDNRSYYQSIHGVFTWSVGKHQVAVQKLLACFDSGRGFYAYKHKRDAFHWEQIFGNPILRYKMIAVYIKPKDVVYMGNQLGYTVFVCRRLEVKSLHGLRKQ